jgi:hypothetical protein
VPHGPRLTVFPADDLSRFLAETFERVRLCPKAAFFSFFFRAGIIYEIRLIK